MKSKSPNKSVLIPSAINDFNNNFYDAIISISEKLFAEEYKNLNDCKNDQLYQKCNKHQHELLDKISINILNEIDVTNAASRIKKNFDLTEWREILNWTLSEDEVEMMFYRAAAGIKQFVGRSFDFNLKTLSDIELYINNDYKLLVDNIVVPVYNTPERNSIINSLNHHEHLLQIIICACIYNLVKIEVKILDNGEYIIIMNDSPVIELHTSIMLHKQVSQIESIRMQLLDKLIKHFNILKP